MADIRKQRVPNTPHSKPPQCEETKRPNSKPTPDNKNVGGKADVDSGERVRKARQEHHKENATRK